MSSSTFFIEIKGRVQGVGFRPFIYRLAKEKGFGGWVMNDNTGVKIKINAEHHDVMRFTDTIRNTAPEVAEIKSIDVVQTEAEAFFDFQIRKSKNHSQRITEISPDIAICKDCLQDLKTQTHRINYPLINCTNCGPRFSIIKEIPYDRHQTTMHHFQMCNRCKEEYTNILDRRFHAQPVACNHCGPQYELLAEGVKYSNFKNILSKTVSYLNEGKIIALKSTGGYHLVCDALNIHAVETLRQRKLRDAKPFAVMFRDINTLEKYAHLNKNEKTLIQSWIKPIVLLKERKMLAPSVSPGLNTIGAILPYMPFHYLLFEKLNTPALVLTSGNLSDEPIVISEQEAERKLGSIVDAIISYNREIHNRTDDSVSFISNQKKRIIRRSRGYVPNPVSLNLNAENIFATGGELKNTFCLGKDKSAILSPYIGDMKNLETSDFFESTLRRFKKLFRVQPELITCDMHPDYYTTKFAESFGLPLVKIQHHHAHIASVLAEHHIDDKVIGISFDGTGYGLDGKIWGSEFMVCDLNESRRHFHFDYMKLPGGEKAIKEPWRIALWFLNKLKGNSLDTEKYEFLRSVPNDHIEMVLQAIQKGINVPESCGAGRLFDAVSALLNVCTINRYEAEAPMRLEAMIQQGIAEWYPILFEPTIPLDQLIAYILEDMDNRISPEIISAKFHNTIIQLILEGAKRIRSTTGITRVALSGGTFQNRYILEHSENLLEENGFKVFTNLQVPLNDGGISLGQLAIAAKRRILLCV